MPAGKPVVALLPPPNIKVRAFVPEPSSALSRSASRCAFCGWRQGPFVGRVAFVSPQAEYTPPVIYSQESRSKLVFMIEARFDPQDAAELHPGQPVDREFEF